MKYVLMVFTMFAAAPAWAHPQHNVVEASYSGLLVGLVLIALAGMAALWEYVVALSR